MSPLRGIALIFGVIDLPSLISPIFADGRGAGLSSLFLDDTEPHSTAFDRALYCVIPATIGDFCTLTQTRVSIARRRMIVFRNADTPLPRGMEDTLWELARYGRSAL